MDAPPRVLLIGGSPEARERAERALARELPGAPVEHLPGASAGELLPGGEADYRALMDQSPEPIFIYTQEGIEYANPAATAVVGLTPEEVLGRSVLDVVHPDDRARVLERMQRVFHEGERLEPVEHRVVRSDGEIRVVEAVTLPIFFRGRRAAQVVARDVTARKRAEEQLRHAAYHDSLTGLPNRRLFLDRLGHALELVRRGATGELAVLFLDLDRLKAVNDSLGHRLGDELLREVAGRLRAAARAADTVARFGGDEFLVLMEDVASHADALEAARRLQGECFGDFVLSGHRVRMGASVGIVFSAGEGDPDTLIHQADLALYRAKEAGRSHVVVFDPEMHREARDRLSLESDLAASVQRGGLVVHYQPIVRLDTGRVAAVEALARWPHPERGLVPPDLFIRVAEEMGIVDRIDAWVLAEACREVRPWDGLSLSVNVSARELASPAIVAEVERVLARTGLAPSRLALEVTEHALIRNAEAAMEVLRGVKSLGVFVHLDDFGTGYSSLQYVERFPIDALKVDRSFLRAGARREAILRAIVRLAHELGLEVIAEGVESIADLERLREMRCDYAQGFHFSRPQAPAAVAELLAAEPVW